MDRHNGVESLSEVFHKEKNQKKYNKTNGQVDNLKKYGNPSKESIDKSDNMAKVDKQIQREAKFIKNIHIDDTLNRLQAAGLLLPNYGSFYAGACHTLGVSFVTAQADVALNKGKNPQALFHFLINKALNKAKDGNLPRFGGLKG